MEQQNIQVLMAFAADDQAWIRRSALVVPRYWEGHHMMPTTGDAVRIGGRQFVVQARVWEHDGVTPVLRLLMSSGGAESDTVFG